MFQAMHFIPDAAMNAFLKFIGVLLRVLGRLSPLVALVALAIPNSVYRLTKTDKNSVDFTRYVFPQSATSCIHSVTVSLFLLRSGVAKPAQMFVFLTIHSRHHTHESGQILMKTIQFTSTRCILYPFKVFFYRSLVSLLQDLLVRPQFADLCQHWKSRSASIFDVYYGKVWKEFQFVGGENFLAGTETLSTVQTHYLFSWCSIPHRDESSQIA